MRSTLRSVVMGVGVVLLTSAAPVSASERPSIEEATGGKVKVGDIISAENVDIVRELMPESLYLRVKDGAKLKIIPYTEKNLVRPPYFWEATERNAGKAVLKSDGTVTTKDGQPWIGGIPFLKPEDTPNPALAVAANALYVQFGVDEVYQEAVTLWHEGHNVFKRVWVDFFQKYMVARANVEPTPYVPGFLDEARRGIVGFANPYDIKGIYSLNIVYVDQSRLPDGYLYVPVLRRLKRVSTAQRYDSLDGSDLTAGDIFGHSDPLGLWNYRLIDKKPMLTVGITGFEVPGRGEGTRADITFPMQKGEKWLHPAGPDGPMPCEFRETYLLEDTPKDPGHIYSKKVQYIDAELFQPTANDFFDKSGKLWKSYHVMFQINPQGKHTGGPSPYSGTPVPILNMQTGTGTFYYGVSDENDRGMDVTEWFSKRSLIQRGR